MKSALKWSFVTALLILAACAIAACVSASYEHREFYPPQAQPAVQRTSYQPETHQPGASRGAIKSETIVRGQDSTPIINGTGGLRGMFDGAMSFAGQIPSLYGIGGTAGVAGLLLGFSKWRNSVAHGSKDDQIKSLQAKIDSTWDEAYHKGYTAGVAARGSA